MEVFATMSMEALRKACSRMQFWAEEVVVAEGYVIF
jgi:hypothetical protein